MDKENEFRRIIKFADYKSFNKLLEKEGVLTIKQIKILFEPNVITFDILKKFTKSMMHTACYNIVIGCLIYKRFDVVQWLMEQGKFIYVFNNPEYYFSDSDYDYVLDALDSFEFPEQIYGRQTREKDLINFIHIMTYCHGDKQVNIPCCDILAAEESKSKIPLDLQHNIIRVSKYLYEKRRFILDSIVGRDVAHIIICFVDQMHKLKDVKIKGKKK